MRAAQHLKFLCCFLGLSSSVLLSHNMSPICLFLKVAQNDDKVAYIYISGTFNCTIGVAYWNKDKQTSASFTVSLTPDLLHYWIVAWLELEQFSLSQPVRDQHFMVWGKWEVDRTSSSSQRGGPSGTHRARPLCVPVGFMHDGSNVGLCIVYSRHRVYNAIGWYIISAGFW